MKKTIIISLALLSLFLLFCKEETPVESEAELYTFSGKVYNLVDSQKVYMENVKVFFREDSILTDSVGLFVFEEVPSGEYQIEFLFITASDSLINFTEEVEIIYKDKYKEFLLYEDESELSLYTFSGKVYYSINSQKIYKENVKVFFRENSTTTNSEGAFVFENVPSGKYPIKFIYTIHENIFDSTITEVSIDTVDRYKDFFLYEQKTFNKDLFPLQVGNIWVYGCDDLSKEYCRIVETVVIDNLTYYRMEIKNPIRNSIRYSNYRIDSQTGYLYRLTSALTTDLSLGEGNHELQNSDGQTIKWISVDVFDKYLFGENKEVVSHSISNGEVVSNYEFVSGIGVIRYSSSSFLGFEEKKLFGAVINNTVYGDTSHIEVNKNLAYYPLSIGNIWIYNYNKFVENGDTIRSTELKREIIGEELMSNGITYFKIENLFDDSLTVFFEWQKMDSLSAKLYGFDAAKNVQYTIEDYNPTESGFKPCKSYMPSILAHAITDISPRYSDSTKSFYGWDKSAPCFSLVTYEFIKDVGISKIVVSCKGDSTTIIEEIKLVSWNF